MKMVDDLITIDASPCEMLNDSDLQIIQSKTGQSIVINVDGESVPITWRDVARVNNLNTRADMFNWLLSRAPKTQWIKTNKYANNSQYIPIAKIEQLLKQIFRIYKIEILRENCWLNGFVVTVRLHYLSPIDGNWYYHDGIGAIDLQTKQGSTASDLHSIASGAWSRGVGIARSEAIKNAAKSFGDFFGANLNRIDVEQFQLNPNSFGKSNREKLINK